MLNSNIYSTCPHNIANFSPLTFEIHSGVWGTQEISTGFTSWLCYCTDITQRRTTKLCTMFGRLLGWYIISTFWGSCLLTEFCQVQSSLCVQVLHSPKLAALQHSTRAVCVSQTLRRGIRNGITELSQTAPPIFDRAAITLSVGPHSSLYNP